MSLGAFFDAIQVALRRRPRIQIVAPTDSWILERMGGCLARHIPGASLSDWKPDESRSWDLTYFVNYALYRPSRNAGVTGGWFTHKENDSFELIAREMDFAVSQAKRYVPLLRPRSGQTFVIPAGIDLDSFVPKLRLGVVGRSYESGRKGEELMAAVKELRFVEVVHTEGKLAPEELPAFYNTLDFILITSRVEGGPLSLTEGLACGKPAIAPDVGMVPEFSEGIHRFDADRPETLFTLLEGLYRDRLRLRQQVEHMTWENFARRHAESFASVLQPRADARRHHGPQC
jgi:glycosyltransferase involved in cell wall biosynthesis